MIENPLNVVKTERDERLWTLAKEAAARQGRAKDWPYVMGIFMRMKHREGGGDSARRNPLPSPVPFTKPVLPCSNPSADLPLSPRAVENYQRFHGADPDRVDEKRLWVPGELMLVGRGIDVGYDVTNKQSEKDGYYVHDFGHAVEIYRRAEPHEQATVVIHNFPTELTVMGNALGFTFTTEDGHKQEVKLGRRKLAFTPDCKRLVVVGASGVEFVLYGGKMHVTDWIYD